MLQIPVKLIFKEPKGKRCLLTNFFEKKLTPAKVNGRSATEFTETNFVHQGLGITLLDLLLLHLIYFLLGKA